MSEGPEQEETQEEPQKEETILIVIDESKKD